MNVDGKGGRPNHRVGVSQEVQVGVGGESRTPVFSRGDKYSECIIFPCPKGRTMGIW